MKKLLLLFGLLIGAGAMAQQSQQVNNVSVVGEGSVTAVPDNVVISARVEHTGDSAQEVKSQNDKVISDLLVYLKEFGIPSENVKTEYLRLRKEQNYNTKEEYYAANQALSIRVEDMDSYEELMGGLLDKGLNRIDGISFETSKQDELQIEARKKAVIDAKEKAQQYAQALGQKIGPAIEIRETGASGPQPILRAASVMSAQAGYESGSGPQIAPGELEITTRVNVSFLLR